MKQLNRRSFIKGSMFAAAALSLPARSWASVSGANEDIRVAVVGIRSRGGNHISDIRSLRKAGERVRMVAICDVDREVLDKGAQDCSKNGESVETFTDIRKLLENKDIDAISVATPNHWHALITIWACQAGKDVYIEKPVSHNVWEGRQMVRAARAHRRMVQTGTQSRSSHAIAEAVDWVRQGNLGKIVVARGLCYKRRASIGKVTNPQPVPSSVDYDLWCGPAPKDPLMRKELHYDWHWVWPTGNGDLGNQGIHQMDIARWFLGVRELSPRVFSIGGRLGYEDDGTTANTQIVYHDYPGAPLIFEVRGLPEKTGAKGMDKYKDGSVAVIIECEGGHVLVPNYTSAVAIDKSGNVVKKFQGASNHHANFFRAMRSRMVSDLNADIVEGHLSSALCHTGNISYRVGKQASPGEIRERIKGETDAQATFDRMAEHLAANDVDIDNTKLTLGAFLRMNPDKERFIGNREANKLLTRDYRKGFEVPAKV